MSDPEGEGPLLVSARPADQLAAGAERPSTARRASAIVVAVAGVVLVVVGLVS